MYFIPNVIVSVIVNGYVNVLLNGCVTFFYKYKIHIAYCCHIKMSEIKIIWNEDHILSMAHVCDRSEYFPDTICIVMYVTCSIFVAVL